MIQRKYFGRLPNGTVDIEIVPCNACPFPNGPVDLNLGDGWFVPSMNRRFEVGHGSTYFVEINGVFYKNHLNILERIDAQDSNGCEILAGMIVASARNGTVEKAKVLEVCAKPYHVGCGFCVRPIKIEYLSDGKRVKVSESRKVMILE